jgi:hypothetical protein
MDYYISMHHFRYMHCIALLIEASNTQENKAKAISLLNLENSLNKMDDYGINFV